jgi:hypothetical protein
MKKNVLLIIPILLIGMMANAQITVTNAVFPSANQYFETAIINGLQNVNITAAGPNQTWDMSNLQGTTINYTVQNAATGSSSSLFPTATIILPEFGGTTGEGYVKVDANSMQTVGIVATIDGLVSNFPVPLGQPRVDLETPLNYSDVSSNSFDFQVTLDPHNPPGTQLDSVISDFETQAGGLISIDSIRVTFTTNRTTEVDAWGNLTTPTGSYDVLRLRKVDTTNTVLEVKISVFGIPNVLWQDPTDPNGLGVNPADLEALGIGIDTIITYDFWSATEQQPILSYVTDGSGSPTYGQYALIANNTRGIVESGLEVIAYPNPATDNFTLEMNHFEVGDYTLKMYNIIGKEVKSIPFRYSDGMKLSVQTGDLQNGTYVYRILNKNKESLVTRRIIVSRP